MANLPVPAPLSDADYEAIEGAVMETARGRWFLAEFARRNRNADTTMLLNATITAANYRMVSMALNAIGTQNAAFMRSTRVNSVESPLALAITPATAEPRARPTC